ncbi:MAG: hypothetical protein RHS_6139 [Robinsoniella sp. RHS]|nr:MAG: hypothetical protein RHS_6139 [Robinsoniella sp. RHS]
MRPKLFDGLCNNKGPLAHVIKGSDFFGSETGITAVNKFLTAEFIKNLLFQGF